MAGKRLPPREREQLGALDEFSTTAKSVMAFLSVLHEPAIVVDKRGVIIQANPGADKMFGYRTGALAGTQVEALLPEHLRKKHKQLREQFHRNPHPRSIGGLSGEYAVSNRRGENLYLEINLTPLTSDDDPLVVATLRDVTAHVATRNTLMSISRETFAKTSQGFFQSLVHTLAGELKANYITIGRLSPAGDSIETIAFLDNGSLVDNIAYDLKGTPCETTIARSECVVTADLQKLYPEDTLLQEMNVHSYIGVRLYSSSGEVYGLINALFDTPIDPQQADLALYLLKIIAMRGSPELERLEAEASLKILSSAVELSPNAVLITNRDAVIEYVNQSYCEMTGYSLEECIGRKVSINASGSTPDEVYSSMWTHLLSGRQWHGELQNKTKDGTLYWARTKVFPIRNDDDEVTHFVGIQEDISTSKQLTEKLDYETRHDRLTGLINRGEFEFSLHNAVNTARRYRAIHSLCLLNLDQFKIVNDTSGHAAGDALLQLVGDIIRNDMRANDVAARLSGDEFGLILDNCSPDQARRIVENILSNIKALNFEWEGKLHAISASTGIVEITGDNGDPPDLMKHADLACYTARDEGTSHIHIYHDDNANIHRRRTEVGWVPEINSALSEDRFIIYLHPVVPTLTFGSESCIPFYHEVLIRMIDTNDNLIPPGSFLPSVERYHLSAQFDHYVINKVFAWIAANPATMKDVNALAINLSGASIAHQGLLDFILDSFRHGVVPADKVKFEITETAAISNIADALHFMHAIREAGSHVALDDFGSGFSSFPYLKSLPADILKIDGTLVREIASDHASFIMVKMINEMAHELGFETVAEYVENDDILSRLRELGIDYMQGYRIALPAPMEQIFPGSG